MLIFDVNTVAYHSTNSVEIIYACIIVKTHMQTTNLCRNRVNRMGQHHWLLWDALNYDKNTIRKYQFLVTKNIHNYDNLVQSMATGCSCRATVIENNFYAGTYQCVVHHAQKSPASGYLGHMLP